MGLLRPEQVQLADTVLLNILLQPKTVDLAADILLLDNALGLALNSRKIQGLDLRGGRHGRHREQGYPK